MVFINDEQQALKSNSMVSEKHFTGILRSKFTDFVSKKTQFSGKTAVDKNAWIKACKS